MIKINKYLLIDKLLFPVIPSGITYELSFIKKKDFNSKNLLDLENSIKKVNTQQGQGIAHFNEKRMN